MRRRINTIQPEFVELMPSPLQPGILYISQKYRTASHLCACGCGERVVTPLSQSRWKVVCNSSGVSLYPSIGNWNYACRSHYWILHSKIEWSGQLSARRVSRIQRRDRKDRESEIETINRAKSEEVEVEGIWQRLRTVIFRLAARFL